MKTSQAGITNLGGRLQRLAETLSEMKDGLTDAVGDAQDSLAGARESAVDAIADRPLRWTMMALVAGLVVGAIVGYRRSGH